MKAKNPRKKGETKEKILAASRLLFVAKGYSATSLSEVAKEAQVNQSLIHHHFENKEKLWEATRQVIFADYSEKLCEQVQELLRDVKDKETFIRGMIHIRFHLLLNDHDATRLLQWQSIEGITVDMESIYTGEMNIILKDNLKLIINKFKELLGTDSSVVPLFYIDAMFALTANWFEGKSHWFYHAVDMTQQDKDALVNDYEKFLVALFTHKRLC